MDRERYPANGAEATRSTSTRPADAGDDRSGGRHRPPPGGKRVIHRQNGDGVEAVSVGYPLPADRNGHIVRPVLLRTPARNGRPEYLKELNTLIVLETFRNAGAISRADVARLTGISAPTVSKIVDKLVEARLLLSEGAGVSTGGKRPTLLRFNEGYGRVLGIDLGGTHLRVVVASLDGTLLHRTVEEIDATAGPEPILRRIIAAGCAALAASGGGRTVAVALATPGVVDVREGVVVGARNLRGWQHVPVRDRLGRGFGVPVTVENDVNLAAVGERWQGAGHGHDDIVFVSIGTGIGAGILIGGEVHRGHRYAAGEVNSLPSGYPSPDGGEAGLEDVASGPAIVRRAAARGIDAAAGSMTTDAVFAAAARGEPLAAAVIGEALDALARGVAALVAGIDPSVVVIGGGVSRQGEALLGPLRERVAGMVRLRAPIVRSALGVDAQLYGAVFAALRLADESLAALSRLDAPADAATGEVQA